MRWQTSVAVAVGAILAAVSISNSVVTTQVLQSGDRVAPPTTVVAIRAGRLFDAKAGTLLTNQVVLIRGDRIAEVGPSVQIPAGAAVIDLSGATVLPGMIDTHLHIMPQNDWSLPYKTIAGLKHAQEDLRAGFTTIVDLSARGTWATIDIRNAINRGLAEGPRMQVAGPEIDPRARSMAPTPPTVDWQPFADDLNVNGPWGARLAVRKLKAYGADWVKIYSTQDFMGDEYQHFKPDGTMVNAPSLTLEEMQAITDEAHRRGMKVACHTFGGEAMHNCIVAGVDKIEHGTESTTADLQLMAQKKIPLVITAENMLNTDRQDLPRSGGKVSRLTLTVDTVKRAMAAGVSFAFGSDMNDEHGKQQRALANYVKWGMTPVQALQTITIGAANALNYNWAAQIGTLEKGKLADLIAVAGNPVSDVTELERVKFVMKGGRVVRNDISNPSPPLSGR
jgi:imidazolonepropionase-like amidohydrolase